MFYLQLITLLLMTILLGACEKDAYSTNQSVKNADAMRALPEPHYIGGEHCQSCHQKAYQDWHNSHHDLAMQEVSSTTVLGNFNDIRFDYNGVTTEFTKKDDQYIIKTDGPDGNLTSYNVAYVFGVYPLQQYLIEVAGGRLQAFGIAWDSRLQSEGGQRWFHLYPDQQLSHQDYQHWTNQSQTWNFMCAECHSTNLNKNYDANTHTYQTTWSEIDVSCEACHGPASNHLLWVSEESKDDYKFFGKKGLTHVFSQGSDAYWVKDTESGRPQRSEPAEQQAELQVCAACHSRRAQFFEDNRKGQNLLESFLPTTLDAGLYHSDGQAIDEV